jgi:hypothetical protein
VYDPEDVGLMLRKSFPVLSRALEPGEVAAEHVDAVWVTAHEAGEGVAKLLRAALE